MLRIINSCYNEGDGNFLPGMFFFFKTNVQHLTRHFCRIILNSLKSIDAMSSNLKDVSSLITFHKVVYWISSVFLLNR